MAVIARAMRIVACALGLLLLAGAAVAQTRVADLTRHPGAVPRRLAGYGLVTGLDGTGDRSWGSSSATTPSVRSVVNLLRRFHVEVPPEQLRLRNVAAVLVTAEVSPWLRAGGRFDVQVSALGDATSLRGGVLWITPMVTDPDEAAVATAQGVLTTSSDDGSRMSWTRRANAGRVSDGGVVEVDPPAIAATEPKLLLRDPDLGAATRLAQAIDGAFGAGTATVDDPGSLTLKAPAGAKGGPLAFLAAVDTVQLELPAPARIVIDARDGSLVAGGELAVGPALVQRAGVTLTIGGGTSSRSDSTLVHLAPRSTVQDVAAGLHAAGLPPDQVAAVFESLRVAGALHAEVVLR